MFLAHGSGTDYVEPILWCFARKQILVLVSDEAGVPIASGEIATPEFLSFWHQRDPICVELIGPNGRNFDLQIIMTLCLLD